MMRRIVSGIIAGSLLGVVGGVALLNSSGGDGATARIISPEQQDAIADAAVSDSEVYDATARMLNCMRDKGIAVSDPIPAPQGGYTYAYLEGEADHAVVRDRASVVVDCYQQHLAEVDRVRQTGSDVQASAVEVGHAILRCVEERKKNFTFSSNAEELMEKILQLESSGDSDFRACWATEVGYQFDESGAASGAVNIAYTPLPR